MFCFDFRMVYFHITRFLLMVLCVVELNGSGPPLACGMHTQCLVDDVSTVA